VVVKVAFGIGDALFNLEENWGEFYAMGMENLMVEIIVRGDVKVVFLASFFLLVGDLSSRCFLQYNRLEDQITQHHHCNATHHQWNRIPSPWNFFYNLPFLD
jgi:hypothetical protein